MGILILGLLIVGGAALFIVLDVSAYRNNGDCPVCRGHIDQRGVCTHCGDSWGGRHD